MTATTIRLGDLDNDPVAFEGQDKRLEQTDDLFASIPHEGLLQSLLARPWSKGKAKKGVTHGVVAGRRRFKALRRLRDAKASIMGVLVTDDWPVPVIVRDMTDEEVLELSVTENVQRVDMPTGQEAVAFADMAKTSSVADIALRFAKTEKYVRQRLRLAALHPQLLAMLDDGKLPISSAEAFTVEPDQTKQFKALKKLNDWQLTRPNDIRQVLTQRIITAKSTIAKMIGTKAYKAAGGLVLDDEFTGEVYWISEDLISSLLEAHWKNKVEEWQEAGWLFVETYSEFTQKDQYAYGNLYGYQELRAGKGGFTTKQKGVAGVVYWPDGSHEPKLGMVRKNTKVDNSGNPVKATKSDTASAPADLNAPGPSTASMLNDRMTRALQAKVADDPGRLALIIVVATLHARRCYYQTPPVRISADGVARLEDAVLKTHPMGANFPSAVAWGWQQSNDRLLATLSELVAATLDVRGVHGVVDANKRALIDLVDPDVLSGFDPVVYLTGLTKPLIAAAAREFAPESEFRDGKKGDLVTAATALWAGSGWLPPQLQSATYAGPGSKRPDLGKPDPADDFEDGGDSEEEADDFNEDESELVPAE